MKPSIRTTFQVLSLAALAALAIYLAPKYSNPFKYHFEEGQPWGYGLVTAEFDFPIYKTNAQLSQEYAEVLKNYTPCYTMDSTASYSDIYVVSLDEFERINQSKATHVSIINNRVATTIDLKSIYTPKTAYQLKHKELVPNLQYDSLMEWCKQERKLLILVRLLQRIPINCLSHFGVQWRIKISLKDNL